MFSCFAFFLRPLSFLSRTPESSLADSTSKPENCIENYYTLLSASPDAPLNELKQAYHRALLQHHPDKQIRNRIHSRPTANSDNQDAEVKVLSDASVGLTDNNKSENPVSDVHTISLLKEAYETLSHPEKRKIYDALLSHACSSERQPGGGLGPRPAQVVSLEDFQLDDNRTSAVALGEEGQDGPWRYPCRCGGWYRISTDLMEEGKHLIGCGSCSEVIWCGFEEVQDDD